MTDNERELLAMLREIVGPGRPGYPTVLEYHHDTDTCEMPENCGHCLMVRKARALLTRVDEKNARGGKHPGQ